MCAKYVGQCQIHGNSGGKPIQVCKKSKPWEVHNSTEQQSQRYIFINSGMVSEENMKVLDWPSQCLDFNKK